MFSLWNELFPTDEVTSSLSRPVQQLAKKRKRTRREDQSPVSALDFCSSVTDSSTADLVEERPRKKVCVAPEKDGFSTPPPTLMNMIPNEVVSHVLSFCGGTEDRFAVSATCKSFQQISTENQEILQNVKVGGDANGTNGILTDDDTPTTAEEKLLPFVKAQNLEAIYMLGMMKAYCNQNVDEGIELLKTASAAGYTRATYTLGLVLRDVNPTEAKHFMQLASQKGYLPALQETLPARLLKSRYGEPPSSDLCQYLDPGCLNRLLARHYVLCPHLRELNTSHCWNPLCGKWAFRTGVPPNRRRIFPTPKACSGSSDGCRVSRMKMCSRCCRAKYCSKLCQVYDWRSGRHKVECPFL